MDVLKGRNHVNKLLLGAMGAFAAAAAVPADAAILAQYYSVLPNGRDFQGNIPSSVVNNGVQQNLGPNGRPVISAGNPLGAQDVNANGELLWWSPGASALLNVVETGSQVIATNSFNDQTFFAPNGNGQNNGSSFLTAIFSGSFFEAQSRQIQFTLGSDDDAFLFLNGVAVAQVGGIHGNTVQSFNITTQAGSNNFQLFYADRRQTQASLSFSLPDGIEVVPPGVPEPATWGLMLLGFGLIGTGLRTRRRSVTFAAA